MNDSVNENVSDELDETTQSTPDAYSMSEAPIADNAALVKGVMHEQNIKAVTKKQTVGKIFVQIGLSVLSGFPLLDRIWTVLVSANNLITSRNFLPSISQGDKAGYSLHKW